MKQLTKICILTFGISIFFTSCEKDNLAVEENAEQINFKVETITFQNLESHSQKTADFVKQYNNKELQTGLSARTSEVYGKIVDTTNINYLSKDDGYSSATFKVENDSIGLNHFENLVVENYPDGNQNIKLIKYNLTKPVELIDSDAELNSSLTSSETSIYSNSTQSFSRLECIEIGFYTEIDWCEGIVMGADECFNDDGTIRTRTVFITIDEDCTWSSSGGGGTYTGGGNDGGNQNGGNDGGNNTVAGNYTGAGIFVPNIYSGEEDPTNPDFVLAGEVGIFFNNLPQNLQDLTNGNNWVYAYTVDYFRIAKGGVNEVNSQHVEDALSDFENFKTSYYKSNRGGANIDRLNFWAFFNLLNSNEFINPNNTQNIFDIGEFLLGVDSNTDNLIITYLFNNYQDNIAFEFIVDYMETTILSQSNDLLPAMQRLITFMRQYGEAEHEIIADYYDSILEEYDNMTESEKQFIHGQLVEIKNDILWAYVNAVFGTLATDLVIPVVTYALFEATGGLAVKLFQKIPLPMVLRSSPRLNQMIIKTTEMGEAGYANARLYRNTSIQKAEKMFEMLTRDAISTTTTTNPFGTVKVAQMGFGRTIVLRPNSTTVPEAIRVIEYQNFNTALGVDRFSLKFIP